MEEGQETKGIAQNAAGQGLRSCGYALNMPVTKHAVGRALAVVSMQNFLVVLSGLAALAL